MDSNGHHVDEDEDEDEDEEENAHIINRSNNLACQQEGHAGAKTVQHLQLSTFVSKIFFSVILYCGDAMR